MLRLFFRNEGGGAAGREGRQWRQRARLRTNKHHLWQPLSFRRPRDPEAWPGHGMLMTTKRKRHPKPWSHLAREYLHSKVIAKGRYWNGDFQNCSFKVDFQSQMWKEKKIIQKAQFRVFFSPCKKKRKRSHPSTEPQWQFTLYFMNQISILMTKTFSWRRQSGSISLSI